jgi:hypothetical protein
MKGDKGKLPFAIRIPADTEWAREFSGTLLGFDDYVSELFLSMARWALRSDYLSRHGPGRRDGIVRTLRSDYFDDVLLLTYIG